MSRRIYKYHGDYIYTEGINKKRDVPYSTMIGWVRCRLSFALLRASIMSIRGARSSRHRPVLLEPVEVQVAEGHI